MEGYGQGYQCKETKLKTVGGSNESPTSIWRAIPHSLLTNVSCGGGCIHSNRQRNIAELGSRASDAPDAPVDEACVSVTNAGSEYGSCRVAQYFSSHEFLIYQNRECENKLVMVGETS